MPAPADLVFQQTTGTGTGNLALTTVAGKRTFASAFGTGNTNTFDYFISSKAAAEWEIGVGYIDATTGDLVRNTVSLSSNSNSAVSFGAGTKDITNDIKAADQVRGAGTVTNNHAVLFDGTSGSLIKSAGFGLGSIASQAANNVSITGGSISGTTISGGTVSTLSSPLAVGSGGTGLSTLTSGDTLYASATNTLAKLAKGTDGQFLKLVSGLPAWGSVAAAVGSVRLTTYTSTPPNPYTAPAGLIGAIVICTGGGGGGGGVGKSNTGTPTGMSCGGGGAGATAISFLTSTEIGASRAVTIGSGGAAGTGSTGGATAGGNGTSSSFGTLLVAGGGLGGNSLFLSAGSGTYAVTGGAGGSASAGTLLITGQRGFNGTSAVNNGSNTCASGGAGGSSFWGGGGAGGLALNLGGAVAGTAAVSFGSGGGGAAHAGSTGGAAGGAGLAGVCAIFEFIAA